MRTILLSILLYTLSTVLCAEQSIELSVNDDFQTIISAAQNNSRIVLKPGYYKGAIQINSPIKLIGEAGVTIDGLGQGNAITVNAADVQIKNLKVINWGKSLTKMHAGIFATVKAKNILLEKNYISGRLFGIWLDAVKKARVYNNLIVGDKTVRSQDRGNGIHLYDVKDSLIENNEIYHTRDGLYVESSNHNVLKNNRIHHLRYGIHYMYSYHNTVIGNSTWETRTGYALMQSRNLIVKNNQSHNDQNYGMLMNYIVNSTIENNRIESVQHGMVVGGSSNIKGAEGKALFFYNSHYNTIRNNIFANSDIGIHFTAGSEENKIYGNSFIQNATQVKYVASRKTEWSFEKKGNFWSDYLGWDMDGNGVGDVIYEPNDAIDKILWKYPYARVLMNSPAVEIVRYVQNQFPVLKPPGVRDSFPLMRESIRLLGGK